MEDSLGLLDGIGSEYADSLLDTPIGMDLEANGVCDFVGFDNDMNEWLTDAVREALKEMSYVGTYIKGYLAGHIHEAARMLALMRDNLMRYVTVQKMPLAAKVMVTYPTTRKMYKVKCSLTINQIFHGELTTICFCFCLFTFLFLKSIP